MKNWIINLIIVVLLFYPNTVKSMTCVLIYFHNDSLTIGSDCMVSTPTSQFDEDGNRIINYSSACKIRKVNDTFLTGSGKRMNMIIEFIQNYYKSKITKPDLLSHLLENLKHPLEERLNYLKKVDPTHYKEAYDGFMFNRVAIIQFKNELPDVKIVAFSAKTNEYGQIAVDIFYQDSIPLAHGEKLMIPFGRFEAIRDIYINSHYWEGISAVDGIENLLKIQARATPQKVGGPMSIITLTKDSYQWNKKGSCNF